MSTFDTLWDAPMSDRGVLRLTPERDLPFRVSLIGQTTGDLSLLSFTEVPGLGTVVMLHETGGHYFAGRGDRGYAGARAITLLVQPSEHQWNGCHDFRYIRLTDAPLAPGQRGDLTAKVARRLADMAAERTAHL